MKQRFTVFIVILLTSFGAIGQKVNIQPTITPQFFKVDDNITITYDVTGTSMNNWTDAWLWLWIPNRNDITISSNVSPASSNTGATNKAKFTKSTIDGRNLFSISIKISEFVSGSASAIESISQVGMLIKGNDWPNGQSEDFLANITNSFTIQLQNPQGSFGFYNPDDEIEIEAITSEVALIELYIDDVLQTSEEESSSLSFVHTVIADGDVHLIEVRATLGGEVSSASYAYSITPVVQTLPVPEGMKDGINYHGGNTEATLVLVAPNKQNVFVIGDFNDWQINSSYLMNRDDDKFWITLSDLQPGEEYRFQYLVDGDIRIADPYTEKVASQYDDAEIISENRYPGLQPYPSQYTKEEIGFLQPGKPTFEWEATEYVRPAKEDLVVYELLVRDFSEERTYNAVTEKLDYLQNLGINAIELMPIMEFEGNLSWGYNPSFLLAPDKYYGTENDLKTLIDEAHKRGIAIILDIALNHAFGRSPLVRLYNDGDYGAPTNDNPWLNRAARHDYNVGYDFNHESQYTKNYVDRVVKYWIEEYKIDGYRFDLSKGFTQKYTLGNVDAWGQYDASRISLLKRMATVIWETDPDNYVILEHFAANNEEIELSNFGMMLWGNMNHAFRNAALSSSSISGLYHGNRGWSNAHLIGYMESHDEERVMWDLLQSGTRSLEYSTARVKALVPFFLLVPGPKMIWQFGEFGYDEELNNDRLGVKPLHWEYLEDVDRSQLLDVYTSLATLKTKSGLLDSDGFVWDGSASFKWMNYNNDNLQLAAVANLSAKAGLGNPHFTSNGTWYDYFSGDSIEVVDFQNHRILLTSNQFHIFTDRKIDNYIESVPVDFVLSAKSISSGVNGKVFPNPAQNTLSFDVPVPITNYKVIDLSGREVMAGQILATHQATLNVGFLQKGIYVIELSSASTHLSIKFLKE